MYLLRKCPLLPITAAAAPTTAAVAVPAVIAATAVAADVVAAVIAAANKQTKTPGKTGGFFFGMVPNLIGQKNRQRHKNSFAAVR